MCVMQDVLTLRVWYFTYRKSMRKRLKNSTGWRQTSQRTLSLVTSSSISLGIEGELQSYSEERLLRLASSLSWIGASTERKEAGSSRGSSTVCTRLSKELGIFKTFVSFSFYLLRYHADCTSPLHLISKKEIPATLAGAFC